MTILIACPTHRSIYPRTVESRDATIIDLTRTGDLVGALVYQHTNIADSRNLILTKWYDQTSASHLLFHDDDMTWPPELIRSMLALGQPVVGSLYPSRRVGYPIVGKLKDGGRVSGDFVEAENAGAGLLLIEREVIFGLVTMFEDAEPSSLFDYFNPIAKLAGVKRIIKAFSPIGALSEDLSFCQRCNDSGIGLWAHIGGLVGHIGEHEFRLNYAYAK